LAIKPLPNETELIKQVACGSERAFTKLFDAYYRQLGEYVVRLTESVELAEEIVQDVFIKIWTKRECLTEIDNFSYYLFIISRNQTYNFLRKKASERVRQLAWEKQFEEEIYELDQVSIEESYRIQIDKAVNKLPPQQQKVYLLSRNERLKYEEIATVLNISAETVKKHMKLALRSIKNSISLENNGVIVLILLTPLIFK
jgi:RNA polymerase sigma-70 factor (family 1)